MALVPTSFSTVDKSNTTLSNGNLTAALLGSLSCARTEFGVNSGKWYWEITYTSGTGPLCAGVGSDVSSITQYLGGEASSWAFQNLDASFLIHEGATSDIPGMTSLTLGQKIGIALNMDAGTLSFVRNNVVYPIASGLTGYMYAMVSSSPSQSSVTVTANFGATAFTNTVPSGYTSGFGYDTTQDISGLQVDYSPLNNTEIVQSLTPVGFPTLPPYTDYLGGDGRYCFNDRSVKFDSLNLRNFIPGASDFYVDFVYLPYLTDVINVGNGIVPLLIGALNDTDIYTRNSIYLKLYSTDPAITSLALTLVYSDSTNTETNLVTYNTTKSAILNKETHFRIARISNVMRLFVNGVSVGTSTTKIIIRPYSKTLIGGYTSPYFSPFGLYGCNGILTQFSFYKATSGTTTFTPVYKTPRYSAVTKFSNYLSNTNVTCSPDGKKIKLNYPNEIISANSVAINTGRYYFELTASNANNIVVGFVNNSYTGNYTSPLLTPATTNRWISSVLGGALLPTGYNPASVPLGTVSDTIGVYLDTATKSWGYIVNGVDYGYKHVGMTGTSFRMVIGTVSGVQSQSIDTMPEVVVNFGDSAFVNSPPYKYAAGFYSSVTQPILTTPALDSSLKSPGSAITSNGLGISPSGTGQYSVVPTIVKSNFFKNTGKYYFEVTPILNSPLYVGISSHTMLNTDLSRAWSGSGRQSLEVSHVYNAGNAWLKKNGTALTNLATQTTAINGADTSASALIDQPFNTTDSSKPTTIGFAVDYDLGTVSVYFKEISPPYLIKGYKVSGFTPNLNYFVYAEVSTSTQNSAIFNFGASSFQLAVPSGYTPGFDLTGYFGYKGHVYDAQGAGVSRKVMALDTSTGEKLAEVQSATDGSFVISQLPTNNPNCILLALPNVGETVNAARLFNLAPGVLIV